MKIKSSPELLQFYKDWYRWATKWWVVSFNFTRTSGLCGNLQEWGHKDFTLRTQMLNQFRKANLNPAYPFGQTEHIKRRHSFSQHKDPKRLAWVKQRIEDMEG